MQVRFLSGRVALSLALVAFGAAQAGACDNAEGRLQMQLNRFEQQARLPGQSPDKTTGRTALRLGCLLQTGAASGFDIDLYGDYDSAAGASWFDPYNLNYYADVGRFTLTAGYQQKPMGYLEAEQPNGLYNPKSYREGPFDTRPQGRFALGGVYRRESWLLHADLMPARQYEEWAEEEGRFRRGGFIATDREYASGTDVSTQLRLDYFGGDWEVSAMLWHGLSPQSIVRPNPERPGTVTDYYERISQAGVSALYLVGNLSLKADIYYRTSPERDVISVAPGLDWNFYNTMDGRADVTFFLEGYYLEDLDDTNANLPTSFDRDIYAGARVNFNDSANSQLELGVINDVDYGSVSGYMEFNRTLLPQLEYETGLEWYSPDEQDRGQIGFENDSRVYFTLIWYL